MKTENHTVTIPIADYNELLATKDLGGIKPLDESSPIYAAFKEALNYHSGRHIDAQVRNPDPMKGVEIFIRVR